jgi:hypothetical protein
LGLSLSSLKQEKNVKISTLSAFESSLELGLAGAIIMAAGVYQGGFDPAILIGLAVILLAAALFVRTYRKRVRNNREQSA